QCIVLDVSMPDLNGLEWQATLSAATCTASIVFITGNGDARISVKAMKAGAIDFLVKPFEDDELLAAIDTAIRASRAVQAHAAEQQQLRSKLALLTKRECEVMGNVVAGRLSKQIADRLGIAEKTVKVQRQRVMMKMQAKSVAELVRISDRANPPPAP